MLTIIAAISQNNVLGKNNKLIWHLPADLKRFKKLTLGHTIIMGRKTFESIGKPLPGRINIIVTKNKKTKQKNCIIAHSIKEAIKKAFEKDANPFIIGGAEIYKQSLEFAEKIELTKILKNFEGDAFFPELDKEKWQLQKKEYHKADSENPYDYAFLSFLKILAKG